MGHDPQHPGRGLDKGRIIVSLTLRNNFEDQKKKKTQEETKKKTGSQGKIKSEVSFMNNKISGKFQF